MRLAPHPVLLEATTHRHIGHWVGDPQNYRSQSELANLASYDPLKIFLSRIKSRADITDDALKEVELEVSSELASAASFAANSPYPSTDEATKDYLKE
jgi:TPP-dependent pyruvate/acetoin dehydrogenase alpha subunit